MALWTEVLVDNIPVVTGWGIQATGTGYQNRYTSAPWANVAQNRVNISIDVVAGTKSVVEIASAASGLSLIVSVSMGLIGTATGVIGGVGGVILTAIPGGYRIQFQFVHLLGGTGVDVRPCDSLVDTNTTAIAGDFLLYVPAFAFEQQRCSAWGDVRGNVPTRQIVGDFQPLLAPGGGVTFEEIPIGIPKYLTSYLGSTTPLRQLHTAFTFAAYLERYDLGASRCVWSTLGMSSTNVGSIVRSGTGTPNVALEQTAMGAGWCFNPAGAGPPATFVVGAYVIDCTLDATAVDVRINGVPGTTGVPFLPLPTGTDPTRELTIGGYSGSAASTIWATIRELIWWSRVLNPVELDLVRNYLQARWE
jgi:hypothetical protein